MEKSYLIEKNGSKLGPIRLEELKKLTIYSDDLIWNSESRNWEKASNYDELNGVCIFRSQTVTKENKATTNMKKTINISEQLIYSIIIGFSISLVTMIFAHISPNNWTAIPETIGSGGFFSYSSQVAGCSFECMLGERHGANCSGLAFHEVNNKTLTVDEVLSGTFEHGSEILVLGIVLSTIIYIFKRVNFQVIKE